MGVVRTQVEDHEGSQGVVLFVQSDVAQEGEHPEVAEEQEE